MSVFLGLCVFLGGFLGGLIVARVGSMRHAPAETHQQHSGKSSTP